MRIAKLPFYGFVLLVAAAASADNTTVRPAEAGKFVGQQAQVCGIVASATFASGSRNQPTFLNLDKAYPNHVFTAVIWGNNRSKFEEPPEELEGQRICVLGRIELYRGRPQIIVSSPAQITTH